MFFQSISGENEAKVTTTEMSVGNLLFCPQQLLLWLPPFKGSCLKFLKDFVCNDDKRSCKVEQHPGVNNDQIPIISCAVLTEGGVRLQNIKEVKKCYLEKR